MEYRYHIIKESYLNLELLEESKEILKKDGFEGSNHEELKQFNQSKHDSIYGGSVTCGYTRTKDSEPYWVLPYPYNANLDVVRDDDEGNVISKTYTLEELNNFGFDVEDVQFI